MRNKIPTILNILLFVTTFFLSLQINFEPPIWTGYGDPYDYLHQSKYALTDKNFYAPEKNPQYNARPFTIPLFYKIANSDPDIIIPMQKFVYFLSAFFFCVVFLLYIRNYRVKLFFILAWYLFISWWNISGWTNTLLAESLMISLLFAWLASFIYYLRKKSIVLLVIHGIITVLFSFTRDSWPYILLIFYLLFVLSALKWDKKMLPAYMIMLFLSIMIFFSQQHTANIGKRYRIPILNNIVFKVLPDDNYLKWFEEKGMPCIDLLQENYSDLENHKKVYSLYDDSRFTELFDWVNEKGKTVYMEFLITHPQKALLLKEKSSDLKKIFACNIGYTGPIMGIGKLSHRIFPLFSTLSVFLLLLVFILICYREKSILWLFPSILILVFTLNVLLLYSADALEKERHLFITHIMIQFSGIYLIAFILDSNLFVSNYRLLLNRFRKKYSKPYRIKNN